MLSDLLGRVQNTKLPFRHGLMPLFEAIVNSIRAIQERGVRGSITITIERDSAQNELDLHGNAIAPIVAFVVADDGIGFTKENQVSFETLDSRTKQAYGGKGVGRLLWLKAFDRARIESTYSEDAKWQRSRFEFVLSADGVEGKENEEVGASGGTHRTVVRLDGFKDRYREAAPKSAEVISRRIVEHCLEYFLFGNTPSMRLDDPWSETSIDLGSLFQEQYRPESSTRELLVGGHAMHVHDVFLKGAADVGHQLHFCAHNRVVQSFPLAGRVPHLNQPLVNAAGDGCFYQGYVTGAYLDEHVDGERTGFDIDRKDELPLVDGLGGVTWDEIFGGAVTAVADFLGPRTTEARERAVERVREFVETREPKYRPLLVHRRALVEELSSDLSDDKLEIELHKGLTTWRHDLHKTARESLAQLGSETDFDRHRDSFRALLGELQEVAKSDLADYVIHRATVLSFFDGLLGRDASGDFQLEDALHGLFFPMRTTSDGLDFDEHNLWILDEKLAYHRYLASDVALAEQDGPVEVPSQDRPDILVYNRPVAFTPGSEPFSSVVVIEFKRPERNDYNEEKSPIRQVLKYVRQIREGKARRDNGSTIEAVPDVPFYCYVVATLTNKLKQEAADLSFTEAPDRLSLFHYNSNYKAFIEVSSYRKILEDAKKRNKAFFDRLHIALR